jgi:hypothetical protein
MASFAIAKAPVAPAKALKGLTKAAPARARKVTNMTQAKEMMVWTPNDNKCGLGLVLTRAMRQLRQVHLTVLIHGRDRCPWTRIRHFMIAIKKVYG